MSDPWLELDVSDNARSVSLGQETFAQCDVRLHIASRPDGQARDTLGLDRFEVDDGGEGIVEYDRRSLNIYPCSISLD